MGVVAQFLTNSRDLKKFLANPLITQDIKKSVLKEVLGEQIQPKTMTFVMLLVDRGRIAFLHDIAQKFLELAFKEESIEIAKVISAVSLSVPQQKSLAEKLKAITGAKQIKIALKVDPQLIGGFTVEIGSKLIDTSIRGQLRQISNLLGA
jgi:F-type H+-transporting ATPase subunit delta